MRLVFLGLSLSSSWGNGHATTYRALLAALAERGHTVTFLEREQPWYAAHRDLRRPDYCDLQFYHAPEELRQFAGLLRDADAVVVGSYVPDGLQAIPVLAELVGHRRRAMARCATPHHAVAAGAVARNTGGHDAAGGGHGTEHAGHDAENRAGGIPLLCFYDIDTPVTLRRLASGDAGYLRRELVPLFDLYLSFTGGPMLRLLEEAYGARMARALYCSVDPARYRPVGVERRWDLGYLGTYSADRQPALERLLLRPARLLPHRRFVVAGSLYPAGIDWPANVERIEHLPPAGHAAFYSSLGWTLNITRADMMRAGYSPSVRLFEATACGTPVLSDRWPGLDTLFGAGELLTVAGTADVQRALELPETRRRRIGQAGRCRTLRQHTAAQRARELETYLRLAGAAAEPIAAEQGADA